VYNIVIFFLLLANWIVFSGKFDVFHLGLGIISSLFITWISHDFLFHDRKKSWEERMREAGAFLQYIPWLTVEIIKANLHVFKLAMSRTGYEEVAPRIVTIKTYLKTDFAKFVFANSITLTPGTITMLIRGDVFHVHTMSQFLEDDLLEGAIERKVAEVFEPNVLIRKKRKR
jgi:multicomponent Na+:H+ antiporter subunit E